MTRPGNLRSHRDSQPRYVNPEEFLKLLIGRSRWERTVDPELGLTVLRNPDGGDRVVVSSAELSRFRLLPR